MKKIIILLLIITFTISFFTLGKNPPALYWDEVAIGVDAYSISQTGKDIHGNSWLQAIYPSYGDYKAPVPIWLVSIFTKLFGLSEFSVRLPFFMLSWLGLLGLGWILSQILEEFNIKNKTSLIYLCLFIVSLTPWYWHFSHIGFESGMSLGLLIWSMALVLWGLRKKSWSMLLGTLLGLVTVYTYFSARVIVPIFIFILLLFFGKNAIKKWYWVLISIIIFFVGMQPLLKSPYYLASEQLRWSAANIISNGQAVSESANLIYQNGNAIIARLVYHRYWFIAKAFLENYLTHFSFNFLLLNGDPNLRHHSGWGGQLLLIQIIILISGVYWTIKNRYHHVVWMIWGWLLVAPLTASIPIEVPHASRAIYMLLPIAIFYLLGIMNLYQFFKLKNISINKIVVTIILLSIVNFSLYLEDYLNHYPARSYDSWQVKNKEMTQLALTSYDKYSQIIISDAYRLPALSVLFYQPNLINQIQKENMQINDKQYDWLNGFDKFIFKNTYNLTSNENQLIVN